MSMDTSEAPGGLPPFMAALGYAGVAPFMACAAVLLAFGEPSLRQVAERVLIGYGAVTLALLGGVHWGLVLRKNPERATTMLAIGLAPALTGVASTLLPFDLAIVLQVAAFGGFWFYENRLLGPGLIPAPYLELRRWLTLAVIAALGLSLMSSALAPAHP